MLYRRMGRRKRAGGSRGENTSSGWRGRREQYRGERFTALSFIVMCACLVFIKLANPKASLRMPIAMLVSVGLACVIMSYISRRMK
jgi:hypothetical protein